MDEELRETQGHRELAEQVEVLRQEIAVLRERLEAREEPEECCGVFEEEEDGACCGRFRETLEDVVRRVGDVVRSGFERLADPGRRAMEKAETKVAENPVGSLLVAFGAGVALGKVVGFLIGWNLKREK